MGPDGQKMSKSLGNVVDPFELAARHGADALRYYLLKDTVYGQDSAVGEERLVECYNADLANDLGNLLSRVRALLGRHLDGVLPTPNQGAGDQEVIREGAELLQKVRPLVDQLRFFEALELVMRFVRLLNRYFSDEEPWKLAKDPEQKERLGTVLYNIVEGLRVASLLLQPAMPQKAQQIRADLGLGDYTFADLGTWGVAPAGAKMPEKAAILFPKQELEKAAPVAEKKEQKPQQQKSSAKVATKAQEQSESISIDDFAKVELRVARVIAAEKVAKADKLLKLSLDLGDEQRTVVSGIAQWYQPEDLRDKRVVLVANLKPAKLRGIVSQGMILAADDGAGNLVLVEPAGDIAVGSQVR